jgi:hypothetical protein
MHTAKETNMLFCKKTDLLMKRLEELAQEKDKIMGTI